jgi:hypothetical protein
MNTLLSGARLQRQADITQRQFKHILNLGIITPLDQVGRATVFDEAALEKAREFFAKEVEA